MSMDALYAVSRFGLNYERLRLQAATQNIAMSDVPMRPGTSAHAMQVNLAPDFSRVLDTGDASRMSLHAQDVALKKVHDPSNPMADADGMVAYPKIDLVAQMGTLLSASRAYEANVRAFNVLHDMTLTALNLGER
ncbi:flagellar basal body rod protein FlgC [Oleiagrimonas citrea]|uniref:Flagellar basal-body/hook protein C-terminal domain-containing protein n=1 Tax=Oleiagrimonas citrea TaxID=1665687 RepID=A0A846ZN97_9GAMM|nr:flagellar basal body rod C-terminal domain-containing protein [Oleiagrimonas citrea]NKZ39020.1 hypothetical protein [Oleiagrimonas citrea]